jgi:hypothetical protein
VLKSVDGACSHSPMSFVNNFKPDPPTASHGDLYGPQPYDVNWPFPLHVSTLENDVVKLTPFVPRIHADAFWVSAAKRHRFTCC